MRTMILALALVCPATYTTCGGVDVPVHHIGVTTTDGRTFDVCGVDVTLREGNGRCIRISGDTDVDTIGTFQTVLDVCNVKSVEIVPPLPTENQAQ